MNTPQPIRPSDLMPEPGEITFGPYTVSISREQWRYIFAGQAMAGTLAEGVFSKPEEVASISRHHADALLAELERTAP